MRIGDQLAKANRLQQGRMFKIIASCIVAALAIAGIATYAIAVNVPSSSAIAAPQPEAEPAEAGQSGATDKDILAAREAEKKTIDIINGILAAKQDATSVSVGIGTGAALCIAIIWLGLGLTYLALGIAGAAVVGLVHLFHVGGHVAPLLIGILALTAAFTALIKLAGLVLSGSWPVLAIARNVLNEAVRMKISMVFIVMLIFGLAALPGLLENTEQHQLRYRIQSFLQYGTGGTFWLIAILVLVFSASTVAFEQRDKVIWQTMTKPVAAWEYILGKWLGVVALGGVLLAVSASGVFLFTEYLRGQPAFGESAAYVTAEGSGISEDRFVLETQVLTARETRSADPKALDPVQFAKNVEAKVQDEIKRLRDSGERDEMLREKEAEIRDKITKDLPKAEQIEYRSIEPGTAKVYSFSHLQEARDSDHPLMMRFKLNAGSNSPDALYKISIAVQNERSFRTMECPLGQMISLRPPMLPSSVGDDGVLHVQFVNGNVNTRTPNAETMTFPPDGLEVSYSAGGYRANFARVIGVLWVKLAFLSMLAICASTFLSFPVACLVAFTVFLAAEGSGFILESLNSYQTETREGQLMIIPTIINYVAMGVGSAFKIYADLRPTGRLVDGLRLSWPEVAGGTGVLAAWSGVLFALAVVVFRRRELATYSGQ